jgi:hypothetical protein
MAKSSSRKNHNAEADDAVLVGLIPALTRSLSLVAQSIRDGASTMLEPGAGLIGQNGSINQNPNSFGFALEHLQALGFNLNAALQGSDARAYQIPADGTKFGPDIYVDKLGEVIAEFQVKAGSRSYVEKTISSGNYTQPIVTNAENNNLVGSSTVISADGVSSVPVSKDVAHMAADHPYSTATLLEAAANVGEIAGAGVTGATVNAAINVVLESIHQLGPVCRGEKKLEWALLKPILEQALAGLQSGFIRGAAVKVLQRLMGGHPIAALGFTLTAEALPTLIQLFKGDITLTEALSKIGPKMLTSGIVTVMVLLFPPVGMALLAASVLQAVWAELAPEWTEVFKEIVETTLKATSTGFEAAAHELRSDPLNWLGSSVASANASSTELAEMDSLLDALLE